MKPGRHWLYHTGLVLAAVIVIPWFLADKLDDLLQAGTAGAARPAYRPGAGTTACRR
ncbi:hypothetical protein [Streptomyces sp. NRRL B-3648]|uniref:hypothetical protein n=1 Tax=Streptomyces sp. NRRL B-3648 TaxID=1519493 RepID=UPI000A880939|nr:hypothetical protein [Streptomyces sp. NRRL B-3648]